MVGVESLIPVKYLGPEGGELHTPCLIAPPPRTEEYYLHIQSKKGHLRLFRADSWGHMIPRVLV